MKPPHPSTPESGVGRPPFTPSGKASSAEVSALRAGGRATIPLSKRTRGRTASHLPARDRRETDDHAGGLFPGGPLPAPARCFGITDSRQWIDLCG